MASRQSVSSARSSASSAVPNFVSTTLVGEEDDTIPPEPIESIVDEGDPNEQSEYSKRYQKCCRIDPRRVAVRLAGMQTNMIKETLIRWPRSTYETLVLFDSLSGAVSMDPASVKARREQLETTMKEAFGSLQTPLVSHFSKHMCRTGYGIQSDIVFDLDTVLFRIYWDRRTNMRVDSFKLPLRFGIQSHSEWDAMMHSENPHTSWAAGYFEDTSSPWYILQFHRSTEGRWSWNPEVIIEDAWKTPAPTIIDQDPEFCSAGEIYCNFQKMKQTLPTGRAQA